MALEYTGCSESRLTDIMSTFHFKHNSIYELVLRRYELCIEYGGKQF
jgi:hypothetical protein